MASREDRQISGEAEHTVSSFFLFPAVLCLPTLPTPSYQIRGKGQGPGPKRGGGEGAVHDDSPTEGV